MLHLGERFNRRFTQRISVSDTHVNLDIYANKRNSLVLFDVEKDDKKDVIIEMYKDIKFAPFSGKFLDINYNYKAKNLDILNQFNNIKREYKNELCFLFNESITFSKVVENEKNLFDTLALYGLSFEECKRDFVFVIAERQYISKSSKKKIVRTSGIQICTSDALNYLENKASDFIEKIEQEKFKINNNYNNIEE